MRGLRDLAITRVGKPCGRAVAIAPFQKRNLFHGAPNPSHSYAAIGTDLRRSASPRYAVRNADGLARWLGELASGALIDIGVVGVSANMLTAKEILPNAHNRRRNGALLQAKIALQRA
jgi:hypothetical protein